jgi:hypothetical protein
MCVKAERFKAEPGAAADRDRRPGYASFLVLAVGPGRLAIAIEIKIAEISGITRIL